MKFHSQSLVQRALFRIFTEPLTASSCSLFVVIFPGIIFKSSVRVFFLVPAAPIITDIIPAFCNFQILLTSFFRSWYLVMFLISAASSPKSLGTETSIKNADFSFLCFNSMSGHDALFAMSTLDGIISSRVSTLCVFSRIRSCLCFHDCSGAKMLKCLQMCQWITAQMLSCLSVYSCSYLSILHPGRR